ncbi:MAG: D-alanyl-D-alanine carboxypeptidase [Saprospiraceae bacterium]|nr:D-alanyl-D-alanine carboxypeptidase [Saprospiraceae bacterium]
MKIQLQHIIGLFLYCLPFLSSGQDTTIYSNPVAPFVSTSPADSLTKQISASRVFNKYFFGFSLYDPSTNTPICEFQSDKYFIPASNTKLLTLYAALNILPDNMTSLRYTVKGDTLIFWGTADPWLLNSKLPYQSNVINFLKSRSEHLYFSSSNYLDQPYGQGWMWDDYDSRFQPEKSPLPLYGNLMSVKANNNELTISPPYFKQLVKDISELGYTKPPIKRQLGDNTIEYNYKTIPYSGVRREIPFRCNDSLIATLLSDTLNKEVGVWTSLDYPYPGLPYVSGGETNTLLKEMMQESDNFIAEQLLLACSDKLFYNIQTEKTTDYVNKILLYDLPDEPIWADGSGLSRYNLMTPRSMVKLLQKIYDKAGEERIINLFAVGGRSGTIKDRYRNPEGRAPYIYAKTGTLANVHALSGYIFTRSGKMLIFSFMNNNFRGSLGSIKDEMEKTLETIYYLF